MKTPLRVLTVLALLSHVPAGGVLPHARAADRPNVVLILADDMGYSDIGCFGSEIPTPNLDALAANGLRFTQFYNSARCSPTRAALLTGLHPHQAGMGILAEDPNQEAGPTAAAGYTRFLNHDCVTLAEVLKSGGYHTYMSGKWHLGYHDPEKWPLARGFERYYGIVSGASSYFRPREPRGLTLDNTPLPTPKEPDYYTTDAFTDHAIRFLTGRRDDAPFFLYLAFNAPHWPLHAREPDIAKFVGRYRDGWDALRAARHARQVELGIVHPSWPLSPRDDGARAWADLAPLQQEQLDYRMAVYAAQVHRMDWNIGRVVDALQEMGELDNTLLFFLSDNGGCAEPYTDLGGGAFENINDPTKSGAGTNNGSSYGTGWANASNTPFRRYKSRLHEGGIATPLIVHWPAGLETAPGALTHTPAYLHDVMPTVVDATGVPYPDTYNGHTVLPFEGNSLLPVLTGTEPQEPRWLFWEQYNNRAVRHGPWKAVSPAGSHGQWELYNLDTDRTELNDLAGQQPGTLRTLTDAWDQWAARCRVRPKTTDP